MAKVIGLGNALVDIMTRLNDDSILTRLNLPKGSMQLVDESFMQNALDTTRGLPQTLAAGGSAANTINGLANLGISCSFIGKIGNDQFGKAFKADMQSNGIDPKLLKGKAESGRALALVSPDSERTFAVYLGAAIELVADDLSPELFEGYDYFHIEGYLVQNHNLVKKAVELARSKKLTITLDLASYNVVEENREFLQEIIEKYVDIVFTNEEEAKAFTGKPPREALNILSGLTGIAVVKLGSEGSLIKRGEESVRIGVIKAQSIDTTGAGDLYASGFIYGLIHNLSLEQCGNIGAILSGRVIEVIGPKMDPSRWDEIRKLVGTVEVK